MKEECFYELPTNEILKIVGKSNFEDLELLYVFIPRMLAMKGEESTLLLNVIKMEEATLEECIKILSKFKHSQICKRTSELFNEDKELLERDFEHELEELKKENGKLQKETKAYFPPVTEKPSGFESDICEAAYQGKLTSVQYLVEKCHADVEAKDEWENTPINLASLTGRLEVVKYLYETCHADVETKNKNGWTPINNASYCCQLEIIKYLYETCHARGCECKEYIRSKL